MVRQVRQLDEFRIVGTRRIEIHLGDPHITRPYGRVADLEEGRVQGRPRVATPGTRLDHRVPVNHGEISGRRRSAHGHQLQIETANPSTNAPSPKPGAKIEINQAFARIRQQVAGGEQG